MWAVFLGALLVAPAPGSALRQASGGLVELRGVVRVGDRPAAGGRVVLHRISAEFTGPADSVQVGPDGAFRFRLAGVPRMAGGDIYVASFRHQDILYFGEAVDLSAGPPSEPIEVRAYPTMPAPSESPLVVAVRNMLIRPGDGGEGWTVTDVFEIENSTGATLVASEDAPTWSHALPAAAASVQVGQGDIPPEAMTFADGRLRTSAAIMPGTSLVVLHYGLAGDGAVIPIDLYTETIEVLAREPAGSVSVRGLAALDPVEMDGATYRRFAGRDLAPSRIRLESTPTLTPVGALPVVAAVLALLLAFAGAWAAAQSRRRTRVTPASRQQIVGEIARLDEAWDSGGIDEDRYRERRRRLLGRLVP